MSTVDPIVAGTDGSPTAEAALRRAAELARSLGAAVHIVMGFGPPPGAWAAAASGLPIADLGSDEVARSHAEEIVERARLSVSELGVTAHTHVFRGDAAQALITIADGEGAQMIVVGNRGMNGARRVLGSVPNRVSHRARCDVLIVPTD